MPWLSRSRSSGLKGLKPGCAPRLLEIVRGEARRLASGGLDHALVDAALSHAEFVMRERNFGTADGVVLAMSSLAGWLYDEDAATSYLRYEDAFSNCARRSEKAISKADRGDVPRQRALRRGRGQAGDHVAASPLEGASRRARREDGDAEAARIEEAVAALPRSAGGRRCTRAVARLPRLRITDIGRAPELGGGGMRARDLVRQGVCALLAS